MKNLVYVLLLFFSTVVVAQNKTTKYEKVGDLVKASYYDEDGKLTVQGFFKNKKLEGKWVRFDKNGNKTKIAFYEEGKKVGKWFLWVDETLKEINYENNVIVSIITWKNNSEVALLNN